MKVLLAGAAAAALCAAQVPRCDLVPGWTQQGAARAYDASNLFEYMDGNSEGYLLYGFAGMHGVTCVHGGDSILIDISEFADADSAYGMFSANRDPRLPAEALGAGGQVTPRRVIFTKDRFYAELAANPEKDHTPALRAFSAAIEKLLPGSNAVPAALAWFPVEGQKSVRLIPESVLGLRVLQRGYAAEYEFGKAFVVLEPSAEGAAAVMAKLRARFGLEQASQPAPLLVTDRYLGRLCFMQKGRYIAGWANVAEGHDPADLAAALAARLP
ncbi:MAG TPA: DUF6599 family protein [Bryobacteraceae bacterium]|nr:DUF6599 family protein [Bryobacteraceae bacterium]